MALAVVAFLARNFFGTGFELGVETIGGLTRAELAAQSPEIMAYIGHLHVAVAAFIISTGLAVAALACSASAGECSGRGRPRWWRRSSRSASSRSGSSTISSRRFTRFSMEMDGLGGF